MPRVSLRVRLSDSPLWDDSGCFCRVLWSAVVSVWRGRLGLALTIMCAAILLSMASLLFACYAVVSVNTKHRVSSLKGTDRGVENPDLLYTPESVDYTKGGDQVRAMIRDDKTGSSIYIRTPADRVDQQTHTNNRKPMASNIYILLNNNVSMLLNSTNDRQRDQSLDLDKAFHEQSGQDKEDFYDGNITTNKYAVLGAGSAAIRRLPQTIIIGVKKSGTRALLEFIRLHPDVRASGPETHFFDKNYHKGLDWYRRKMPPTIDGQITIEKTPSYFITKDVPRRVYAMSKDVKLIVVVRDPVTRSISDYTQAHTKRPETKPFEQMAFLDNSTGIVDTSWGAIRIGVYAKHLDRWLKYFPLRQIHFVNGEKLITDPAREMAKVQEFLGLKCIVTEKHFYFNESKGFPCLKKHEGSGKPHCLGKSKGRTHPRIDSQAIQKLRTFYHPFNVKFYQMVGQDFGWPVK